MRGAGLWGGFNALIGLLGLYAGLARDRLDYMSHLPELPSVWVFARVVALALTILVLTVALIGARQRLAGW